jgi:hypothetical protein
VWSTSVVGFRSRWYSDFPDLVVPESVNRTELISGVLNRNGI